MFAIYRRFASAPHANLVLSKGLCSSAWSPVEFLECSLLMLFTVLLCVGKVHDLFKVLIDLVSSLSQSLLFSLRSPGNVLALLNCSLDARLQDIEDWMSFMVVSNCSQKVIYKHNISVVNPGIPH